MLHDVEAMIALLLDVLTLLFASLIRLNGVACILVRQKTGRLAGNTVVA